MGALSQSSRFPIDAMRAVADEALTQREQEVLVLLAGGYSGKEVAVQLGISLDTVRFHLKNIHHKLHVHSRAQALVKWLTMKQSIF